MKKLFIIVLALTLALSLFTGCQTADEPTVAEGKLITPLPSTLDVDALDNCTVPVSFEEGDAYVDDSGAMQLKVKVYTYDLYDMVDIANLAVGDKIIRLGEEVEITSIERKDTGAVVINGGLEAGGFDLWTDESTVYFETGFDDAKAYYEIGEAIIRVSTEFEFIDASDLDSEPVTYYPGDFLTDDAGIYYHFVPGNTEIVIEDGFVVAMNRRYIP